MALKLKQDIPIGKNLKMLREKSKLTQEQVAAKLQTMGLPVSREIISQMELGKYNIRVSVLLALKSLYKVSSYDEFFIVNEDLYTDIKDGKNNVQL